MARGRRGLDALGECGSRLGGGSMSEPSGLSPPQRGGGRRAALGVRMRAPPPKDAYIGPEDACAPSGERTAGAWTQGRFP
ncbi:hypothetical protein GCM10010273_47930 [Streptomyces lavendulocolor]